MYLWWRTWRDDRRQVWAEKFVSGDPREAKQHHREHLQFGWTAGLNDPGVTTLEFCDEDGKTVEVAPGWRRGSPADRAYASGGADVVSTPEKAEAPPAEPGSTPGSSTDLPFG